MAMMDLALGLAQQICWDEGYGYREGGHAASYADGVDCGGLVFHCLNYAGYNVADTSPGVRYMNGILSGIGFTVFQYDGNLSSLQHGDIITMVHYEGGVVIAGHTTFIGKDVHAYLDPSANTDITGHASLAKIEGSSTRGHTGQGDSRKNGTGAYWEVWVHQFNELYNQGEYLPTEVYVCRDPNYHPYSPDEKIFLELKILDTQKKRKFQNI